MDDSLLVRSLQGLGNLGGNVQGLFKGNRTFLDSLGQRRPFDQLQNETVNAIGLF